MADPKPATSEAIDPRLVRKLADILNDTGLTEIEVERGDLKIRVAREITVAATMPAPMAVPLAVAAPAASAPTAAPVETVSASPARASAGEPVTSPMVGTIYLQAQPGSPPFVRIGDTVSAGQTLMIVEAMKTMNPIPAPRAGKIVDILIEDGQPVEFGEPLAIIE
jgi:acetyl-CoA carboxylase biotin carboxyl carrier protein